VLELLADESPVGPEGSVVDGPDVSLSIGDDPSSPHPVIASASANTRTPSLLNRSNPTVIRRA